MLGALKHDLCGLKRSVGAVVGYQPHSCLSPVSMPASILCSSVRIAMQMQQQIHSVDVLCGPMFASHSQVSALQFMESAVHASM